MEKKIIVAGGGHGGIAAAALLAEKGFDVTVYEKNSKNCLGYDWTDIFAPSALAAAEIDMPPEDMFEYKTDMTFYSTNERVAIKQNVPKEVLEIKMERRDIYKLLIAKAEKCGVKFIYDCRVVAPITKHNRVVGIKTDSGDFYADLIIDACGCESPVRRGLPGEFGIQTHPARNEKFYVYRGFYNKATDEPIKDKYKVCLLPEGKLGIGWVATEEEYTDLLIGRFEPFNMEEVKRTAEYYRSRNVSLGKELVRGGEFVEIPVRQALSLMVANGYAAIGDSAFMTVPIIGSGIANSLKAAKLLADAVCADASECFSVRALWKYQYNFYKKLGSGLAPLAAIKMLLTKITPEQLDYIFENRILTEKEMTITAESTGLKDFIHLSADMPSRGLAIVKDKDLTRKLLHVAGDVAKIIAICASMPKEYDEKSVRKWSESYDAIFMQ